MFIRFLDSFIVSGREIGILEDDINHKAFSIELYLPDSVISDDGEYLPIEWEARKQIKQDNRPSKYLYQGVISEKDTVKSRFIDLKNRLKLGKQSSLQLFDISNFIFEIITVIILFVIFLAGGMFSTILIVRKKEWKYHVDP